MIKNKKKYQKMVQQERARELRKLTLKKGIERLEGLLNLFGSFKIKKHHRSLPVSLDKLLKPSLTRKS